VHGAGLRNRRAAASAPAAAEHDMGSRGGWGAQGVRGSGGVSSRRPRRGSRGRRLEKAAEWSETEAWAGPRGRAVGSGEWGPCAARGRRTKESQTEAGLIWVLAARAPLIGRRGAVTAAGSPLLATDPSGQADAVLYFRNDYNAKLYTLL
jgi:hypothetical protein